MSSSLNDDGEVYLRIKSERVKGPVPTPKYPVLLQEACLRGHHLREVVSQTSEIPPQVHTANVQSYMWKHHIDTETLEDRVGLRSLE